MLNLLYFILKPGEGDGSIEKTSKYYSSDKTAVKSMPAVLQNKKQEG